MLYSFIHGFVSISDHSHSRCGHERISSMGSSHGVLGVRVRHTLQQRAPSELGASSARWALVRGSRALYYVFIVTGLTCYDRCEFRKGVKGRKGGRVGERELRALEIGCIILSTSISPL